MAYATAGVGALVLFTRRTGRWTGTDVLVGNVGGGVKWLARNRRWGLRTDYRFLSVESKTTASAFGRHARYGTGVRCRPVNLGRKNGRRNEPAQVASPWSTLLGCPAAAAAAQPASDAVPSTADLACSGSRTDAPDQ